VIGWDLEAVSCDLAMCETIAATRCNRGNRSGTEQEG
jgi:hypothetical protein